MTARVAASLLALLLNYLASSEGELSPPLNLSVELLDFRALARWLPGPGNPKGTRYSLEFVEVAHYSRSPWNQTKDCTNITLKQCSLLLNQMILKNYYMRVRAEWRAEQSNWTSLQRSFQPYESLLSAPNLNLNVENHSIWIFLSHPLQSLTEVRIRFSVDLYHMLSRNATKKHIAHNITTESSRFLHLPSGNYCVDASAFFTANSRFNNNTTMCVLLPQDHIEGNLWVVGMGVLLLVSIGAVIGLIFIYCYIRPKSNNIPSVLRIIKRNGQVLIPISEEPHNLSLLHIYPDDCKAKYQEKDDNLSHGYHTGVARMMVRRESVKKIEDGLLFQVVDVKDQNKPSVVNLYSTAAKMEEADECLSLSECHACGVTPRTSFPGLSPTCSKNADVENTLDSEPNVFDEENFSSDYLEESNSSDGMMFNFESNYEPRPDPCCMLEAQARLKH
ncbi:cytokine receptor family member B12 isoform 1-T1 [Clarias gariepinus]